ncbi:MAG: hypothetical protein AB7Q37_18880 [Pyrinomonadaceae bacterium]
MVSIRIQSWAFPILFCLSISGFSQRSAKPADRTESFDPSVTTLPAKYAGNDFNAILSALEARKASLEKGEYETTPEHRERVARITPSPILGKLMPDSTMAFVLRESEVTTEYNADRQVLTVRITREPICDSFTMDGSITKGSAVYQNPFGAVWRVTTYSGNVRGISYGLDQVRMPKSEGYPVFHSELRMDPKVAAAVRGEIRALVVGKLKDRLITKCLIKSEPTFEKRTQINVTGSLIALLFEEIWFFHGPTGEIYSKIK